MQLFLDSGNIKEIKELAWLIDGVTTNPSIVKAGAAGLVDFVTETCEFVGTSVSVEVMATDYEGMMLEGLKLCKIAPQVTVKVPMTWDGLRACKTLTEKGERVNVTLCFTPAQAILAAKAGATYVSPFLGRLEDVGEDGLSLIEDIRNIYDNYNELETKILAASIRNVNHIAYAAKIGADVATAPYEVIKKMINHPLTNAGLEKFIMDAKESDYRIL